MQSAFVWLAPRCPCRQRKTRRPVGARRLDSPWRPGTRKTARAGGQGGSRGRSSGAQAGPLGAGSQPGFRLWRTNAVVALDRLAAVVVAPVGASLGPTERGHVRRNARCRRLDQVSVRAARRRQAARVIFAVCPAKPRPHKGHGILARCTASGRRCSPSSFLHTHSPAAERAAPRWTQRRMPSKARTRGAPSPCPTRERSPTMAPETRPRPSLRVAGLPVIGPGGRRAVQPLRLGRTQLRVRRRSPLRQRARPVSRGTMVLFGPGVAAGRRRPADWRRGLSDDLCRGAVRNLLRHALVRLPGRDMHLRGRDGKRLRDPLGVHRAGPADRLSGHHRGSPVQRDVPFVRAALLLPRRDLHVPHRRCRCSLALHRSRSRLPGDAASPRHHVRRGARAALHVHPLRLLVSDRRSVLQPVFLRQRVGERPERRTLPQVDIGGADRMRLGSVRERRRPTSRRRPRARHRARVPRACTPGQGAPEDSRRRAEIPRACARPLATSLPRRRPGTRESTSRPGPPGHTGSFRRSSQAPAGTCTRGRPRAGRTSGGRAGRASGSCR